MNSNKYRYVIFMLCFITVLLVFGCAEKNRKSDATRIIAHRGAWKADNSPQNSMASLKKALALNCYGSEFDVRMTLDDSLIVTHDPDYNGLVIEESTFEQLRTRKLKNGETLPLLRNYLLAGLEGNTGTRLVCEIKPSQSVERGVMIADKVLALVKELKADHSVMYISFSYSILKRLEETDPSVRTHYLDGSKSPQQLKEDGIDGADYHLSVFRKNPEWIADARENNIELNVWTVNDPEDIDWVLNHEFDFITTDEPELVFERVKKMNNDSNTAH
ncbi:MAG: glycerophosphodiester phosphodiesterase family protein [Bacteroidota bacterium]